MTSALGSSQAIVAYMALFAAVGIVFLFVNMLVGRFLRPVNPFPEKQEIYECGEPTIGSSFVQFDLRFYVVALLFIIFDVEVAFFFPWAAVFGKSTNLMNPGVEVVQRNTSGELELTKTSENIYKEMGVRSPQVPGKIPASLAGVVANSSDDLAAARGVIHEGARQLAWVTIVDIAAFFAVLMIGFAYVWKRGDLDWVRAVSQERAMHNAMTPSGDLLEEEHLLSA